MNKLFSNFLLLLFLGITFNVFSQETINQFDLEGKRTGVWKKYYNNKRIRYEGTFKAGKEVGIFKFYSETSSEHPIIIKDYKNNSEVSEVKFYTVKGILLSEGKMKSKDRTGKWIYYHEDGKTMMSEENYENGLLNGEVKTYYKSGKLTEELHYKNGKLNGSLKRYSSEGVLLDDVIYKDDKLHGPAKYFNVEGKLIYSGNYENDEKVGKWEYFNNEE